LPETASANPNPSHHIFAKKTRENCKILQNSVGTCMNLQLPIPVIVSLHRLSGKRPASS